MFSSPFGAPAPPPGPAAPNVKKKKELPNGFPELLLGNLFSKHFLSAASKVLDGLLITAEPAPLPSGPPDALFTPDVADAMTSRSQDFESLLSCGFMDEKGPTAAAAARFIESLAVASGVVSAGKRGPGNEPLYAPNGLPNTLAAQVAVLQKLHAVTCDQRSAACVPFVKCVRNVCTDDGSLVNELVLQTLSSLIRVTDCRSGRLREPLSALNEMLGELEPLSFYSDWSPARSPPETKLKLNTMTPSEDGVSPVILRTGSSVPPCIAECAIDGRVDTEWKPSTTEEYFEIRFASPIVLTSVEVTWKDNRAARSVTLLLCDAIPSAKVQDDNIVDPEPKWSPVSKVTVPDSPPSVKLSANCTLSAGIRLQFSGARVSNTTNSIGVRSIVVSTPNPAALWTPTLTVLDELQAWLQRVATHSLELSEDALSASLQLAVSSGSFHALLEYVSQLLALTPEADGVPVSAWNTALTSQHSAKAKAVLDTLKAASTDANDRYNSWCRVSSFLSGPLTDFGFDLALNGTQMLDYSNGNRTVSSRTGSNTLAVLDRGFSTGVTTWEFRLDHDSNGGECTCFGAVTKPITDFSYTANSAYMYRCYNGQLYVKGKTAETKAKIHPNDRIRFEFDADEGTIVVFVNDVSQGVCFSDLKGVELFPAIGFYSSDRTASIVSIIVSGSTATKGASGAVAATAPTTTPSSKVVKPAPKPPAPLDPVDVKETAMALPGMAELAELGFHWHLCARALQSSGGAVEPAAEALFTIEDSDLPLAELEARVHAHRQATEKYEEELKVYNAELEAAKAAAEAKPSSNDRDAPSVKAESPKKTLEFGKDLSTRGDVACGVILRLEALSRHYNPNVPVEDLDPRPESLDCRPKPSMSTKPIDSIDLEAPYCVEASAQSFLALEQLLRAFANHMKSGSASDPIASVALPISIALLKLLTVNFIRLDLAHVNPLDVGINVFGPECTLNPLLQLLQQFIAKGGEYPSEVSEVAATTIHSGFEVLFGSPETRAAFIGGLISKQSIGNISNAESGLLHHCLQRFAEPSGILTIIPTQSAGPGRTDAAPVLAFVSALFDVLNRQAAVVVSVGEVDTAPDRNVVESASNMVNTFQRHLFSVVIADVTAAASSDPKPVGDADFTSAEWSKRFAGYGWSFDRSASAAASLLIDYGKSLLRHCSKWIAAVSHNVGSGGPSHNPTAAVALKSTIVYTLLPAFVAHSALLAHVPWFCGALLPSLLDVLEHLDVCVSQSGAPVLQLSCPAVDTSAMTPGAGITDASKPFRGYFTVQGQRVDAVMRLDVPSSDGPVAGVGSCYLPTTAAVATFRIAGTRTAGTVSLTAKADVIESDTKGDESAPADNPEETSMFEQLRLVGTVVDGGSLSGSCSPEDVEAVGEFCMWPSVDGTVTCRPWLSELSFHIASVFGRMVGVLARGPHIGLEEEQLLPWLQSRLLEPGLDVTAGQAASQSDDGWSPSGPLHCDWEFNHAAATGSSYEAPQDALASAAVQDADAFLSTLVAADVSTESSPASVLLAWLQSTSNESRLAARAAKFPDIEIAVLAAIAKHSGLVTELQSALTQLRAGIPGVKPSSDLATAWKLVQRVRKSLRTQKAEAERRETTAGSEAEAKAALETELKIGNNPEDKNTVEFALRKIPSVGPSSVSGLLESVKARALFLLALHPLGPSVTVAEPPSQLQGTWTSTLPPAALQPLLQKWQSTDTSTHPRWGGMITVLARQQSWQRQQSFKGTVSTAAGGAGVETAEAPTAVDDGDGTTAKVLTPLESVMEQVVNYIRSGVSAPPSLLSSVMRWRSRRASARTFALSALAHLLRTVSSSSLKQAGLMWLRPSLRGITEREVRTALPSTAAGKDTNRPWTMRHHYAVGLEACDTSTLNKLQAAFINVFTAMSDTLSSASALCDPTLSAYVMWTWGCDVGTRDHEFLLRSGILPLLASKFSLDAILDEKAHAEAVDSNRSASSSAARPSWKPWRLDDIRTGLLSGWLSKHQVLVHILAAPISAIVVDTGVTPLSAASASAAGGPSDQDRLSEWRKSNGLDDVNAAAIKMTVEELLLLLSTFACYQPPAVPSAAGVAVGATDLSTDVVFASSVAAVEDLTTAGATPFKPKRKKAPRIRYSFRHQDHEHDLRRDGPRAMIANCDSCRSSVDASSVASWTCLACDFDVCEPCFMLREDHEEWEEPFVMDVTARGSTSFSSPEYVHMQPCANRRVYADTTDLVFGNIPEELSTDRFTFIRTVGVDCHSSLPDALSFQSTKPVRVYVGFRSDQLLPDWVDREFLSTPYRITVDSPLHELTYVMFESKTIFLPNEEDDVDSADEDFPVVTVTLGGAQCPPTPGRLSPSSGDFRNYIVFIEELDDDDVFEYQSQHEEKMAAPSLAVGGQGKSGVLECVPAPKPKHTWLRGGSWALFRTLITLLGAGSSDEGTTPAGAPSKPVYTSKYTDELFRIAFNIVTSELTQGVSALSDGTPASKEEPDSHRRLEALEVESVLYAQLQFVSSLAGSPTAKPYIASPDMLKCFLRLFKGGSHRIRRVVLCILRIVSSRLDPMTVNDAVRGVWPPLTVHRWSEVDGSHNPFVGMLLDIAAAPVLLASGLPAQPATPVVCDLPSGPSGHGAGVILQAEASDAIALIRTLVTLSGWHSHLSTQLLSVLEQGASLFGPVGLDGNCSPGSDTPATPLIIGEVDVDPPTFTRVFGSFAVLGGSLERLHVGGAAKVSGGATGKGRIVQYQYGSATTPCRIAYSNDSSALLQTVPSSTLTPVPVVPPPHRLLSITSDGLQSLKALVEGCGALTPSSPTWQHHLCYSALAVTAALLEDVRVLPTAFSIGLVDALYTVALKPKPGKTFVDAEASDFQLAELQARLIEARVAGLSLAPVSSVIPSSFFEPSALGSDAFSAPISSALEEGYDASESKGPELESDVKTAEEEAEDPEFGPYWRDARSLAAEVNMSPAFVVKALDMHSGNNALARAWLTDSAGMWNTSPAFGTFVGLVSSTDQEWQLVVTPSTHSSPPPNVSTVATLTRKNVLDNATCVDKYIGFYDPSGRLLSLSLSVSKPVPGGASEPSVFDVAVPVHRLQVVYTSDGASVSVSGSCVTDLSARLVDVGCLRLSVGGDGTVFYSDDASVSAIGKPTPSSADFGMDEPLSAVVNPPAVKPTDPTSSSSSTLDELDVADVSTSLALPPFELFLDAAALRAATAGNEIAKPSTLVFTVLLDSSVGAQGVSFGVASPSSIDASPQQWLCANDGSVTANNSSVPNVFPSFGPGTPLSFELKAGYLYISIGSGPKTVACTNVPEDVRPAVVLSKVGQRATVTSCAPFEYKFQTGASVSSGLSLLADVMEGISKGVSCTREGRQLGIAVSRDTHGAIPAKYQRFVAARCNGDSPMSIMHQMVASGLSDVDVNEFLGLCEAMDERDEEVSSKLIADDVLVTPLASVCKATSSPEGGVDVSTLRLCGRQLDPDTCFAVPSPAPTEKASCSITYEFPEAAFSKSRSMALSFQVGMVDGAMGLGEECTPPLIIEVLVDGLSRWTSKPLIECRTSQVGSVVLSDVSNVRFKVRRVGSSVPESVLCGDTSGPLVAFRSVCLQTKRVMDAGNVSVDKLIGRTVAVLPATMSATLLASAAASETGYTFDPTAVPSALDTLTVGIVLSRVARPLLSGGVSLLYRLRVLNTDTGVSYLVDVPASRVVSIRKVYGANVTSQQSVTSVLASVYLTSSIQLARQAITAALSNWPSETPLSLAEAGGKVNLIKLMKYVASSGFKPGTLSGGGDVIRAATAPAWASSTFLALRSVMTRLLNVENSGSSDAEDLIAHIVADTVDGFIDATRCGVKQPITRESLHNYPALVSYGGTVTCPGSAFVFIHFDKRCKISSSAPVNLIMYKGASPLPENAIAMFKSDSASLTPLGFACYNVAYTYTSFQPVLIPGDTCCWQFESTAKDGPAPVNVSGISTQYGFKFYALPVSGRWCRESQVLDRPSIDWACWTLQFLLNDVFALLKPGQVHNAALFNALLAYIRSRTASPAARDNVVMLLGQLLSAPWMYELGSLPDEDAMAGLEDVVMKCVSEFSKGSSSGLKYIPPRLLHLLELVLQRRATSAEFTRMRTLVTKPSGALTSTPLLTAPVPDTPSVSEPWGLAAAAAGAVSSFALKVKRKAADRASKLNLRPLSLWDTDKVVTPKLLPASVTPVEELTLLREYAHCLLEGVWPSDPILCNAWMDVFGTSKFVESNHPYRSGESVVGSVVIPGAKKLRVTLHPMCSTPEGVTLAFEAGGKLIASFNGPHDNTNLSAEAKPWKPSSFDILSDTVQYKFVSPLGDVNPAGLWGVAFTISADALSLREKEDLLKSKADVIPLSLKYLVSGWDARMDSALVDLAGKIAEAQCAKDALVRVTRLTLPLSLLCLRDARDNRMFSCLAHLPVQQLRLRFALMQEFNRRLSTSLHCFEIGPKYAWTVGSMLHSIGHCIFMDVKESVLESALSASAGTTSGGISTVYLSNFDASAAAARGAVSPEESECVFVQAFRALRTVDSSALRTTTDSGQNKVFEVKFRGEDGIDAGGVYREGLQRMIEDLFSERFNLMLPCPNAARRAGDNVGSFLPNPAHTSSLALEMFAFAGRLMGISLRFKATLPFMFPSLVWKQLAGFAGSHEDLLDIDDMYGEYIHTIRHCDKDFSLNNEPHAPITSEAAFAEAFGGLTFVATNTGGDTVEIVPGGSSVPVTFANRGRYCDLVEQFRLHEFDTQIGAIRRGFSHIVPIRTLALFTWQEVEYLVSGKPEIDCDLLKKFTQYEGFSPTDKTVKLFWKVFESFTDEERSRYVRFAWGRSRLPSGSGFWSSKHKLSRRSGSEKMLPIAHTCFFNVELPPYSTEEAMRWGLTTAITFGMSGILSG